MQVWRYKGDYWVPVRAEGPGDKVGDGVLKLGLGTPLRREWERWIADHVSDVIEGRPPGLAEESVDA